MGLDDMILVFWMLRFKTPLSAPCRPLAQPEPQCGHRVKQGPHVSHPRSVPRHSSTVLSLETSSVLSVFCPETEHEAAHTCLDLAPELWAGNCRPGWARGWWVYSYRDRAPRPAVPTDATTPAVAGSATLSARRVWRVSHEESVLSPMLFIPLSSD